MHQEEPKAQEKCPKDSTVEESPTQEAKAEEKPPKEPTPEEKPAGEEAKAEENPSKEPTAEEKPAKEAKMEDVAATKVAKVPRKGLGSKIKTWFGCVSKNSAADPKSLKATKKTKSPKP